ncbi:MAG: cation diffusion facilitator family transporter, partial [Planctomycetota bacterium]|nr:cation diffusion facilitator family transporter [Planctomycetota bacterium]
VAVYGSATLLVDALASLADVAASLLLVAAIRLAARPPDDDHPFGHGRYEPLAGLQLAVFLTGVGVYLFFRQLWSAATGPAGGDLNLIAASIPLVASVLLEGVSRVIRDIGRRHRSSALLAEAVHFRIDAVTSLIAAAGIAAASAAPDYGHLVDHVSAMLLAAVVVWLGVRSLFENLHQLMDRVPESASFERVREAAAAVEGVMEVEKIRIQHAGPDAHVDIDIEVDPAIRVDEAHRIAQHVRATIQSSWPSVREVVVHVEPYYAGDH